MRKNWLGIALIAVLIILGTMLAKVNQQADRDKTATKQAATYSSEGWLYAGDFPASAVNITTFQLPDKRFVAYYVGGTPGVYDYKKPGRAFSTDGLSWTVDNTWTCSDLCLSTDPSKPNLPHRKHLVLKDGRIRTYLKSEKDGGIVSYISSDGLSWEKESGLRFRLEQDMLKPTSLELGQNFTPVYTPEGAVRAYYEVQGTKPTGLQNSGCCRVLASAISNDDGLSFAKEEGIRVSANEYKQILPTGEYNTNDPTVIATEGGYRIFFGSSGLSMSSFSKDGLNFAFSASDKGFLPLAGTDPSPLVLPDGRLMVMDVGQQAKGSKACNSSRFPQGCPENYDLSRIVVWDTLPYTVTATRWDSKEQRSTVTIAGTEGQPVTLKALDSIGNCKQDPGGPVLEPTCNFDPAFYTITPTSGTLPLQSVFAWSPTRQADKGTKENAAFLTTEIDGKTAITIIPCIDVSPANTANGCGQ